jgi:hypothetical protein
MMLDVLLLTKIQSMVIVIEACLVVFINHTIGAQLHINVARHFGYLQTPHHHAIHAWQFSMLISVCRNSA